MFSKTKKVTTQALWLRIYMLGSVARSERMALTAKVRPASKSITAEMMLYQTPLEFNAIYTPTREKITAPSDQMSVALMVSFTTSA